MSGSASADGTMELEGTLGGSGNLRLTGNNRLSLQTAGNSTENLKLKFRALPLDIRLETPELRLHSSVAEIPDGVLAIPGLDLAFDGSFDTGKLALPNWSFDGIALSAPDDGERAENHIRLRREADGDIFFDTRAEIQFLPGCPLHDFSLTVDRQALDASMSGSFCVLPEPVSLQFNSASDCQFQGSFFGFTIKFGTGCASWSL
jgi:hypothetical protein